MRERLLRSCLSGRLTCRRGGASGRCAAGQILSWPAAAPLTLLARAHAFSAPLIWLEARPPYWCQMHCTRIGTWHAPRLLQTGRGAAVAGKGGPPPRRDTHSSRNGGGKRRQTAAHTLPGATWPRTAAARTRRPGGQALKASYPAPISPPPGSLSVLPPERVFAAPSRARSAEAPRCPALARTPHFFQPQPPRRLRRRSGPEKHFAPPVAPQRP